MSKQIVVVVAATVSLKLRKTKRGELTMRVIIGASAPTATFTNEVGLGSSS